MKTCTKCEQEKELTEFGKAKGYKDGLRTWCKSCKAEDDKNYYKPYDYETDKNSKLKAAYGISYKEYQTMLEAQNGQCAICGTANTGKRKAFHVDHDHETGEVRGLLCGNCNSGIGNLRDDVGLLKRAIQYLENCK